MTDRARRAELTPSRSPRSGKPGPLAPAGDPGDSAPFLLPVRVIGSATDQRTARLVILSWQVGLLAAFLLAWQYLPSVGWLSSRFKFLDPFDISSPSLIAISIWRLLTGTDGVPSVWPYLWTTVYGAGVGTIVGVVLGGIVGLILSEIKSAHRVLQPFFVFFNSIPRIALLPIIVVIVGPTIESTFVNVVLVVFFLTLFNAFEGGISVRASVVDNARLLGAKRIYIMRYVRLPYVLIWTFAVIPNAVSFGLIIAVANEWLTGLKGMGQLLVNALNSVQAGEMFAVIIILGVVGLLFSALASLLRLVIINRLGGQEAMRR
jgi:NitT/TauT family transport system permease protein